MSGYAHTADTDRIESKLNEAIARIAHLEQQAFSERNGLCDRIGDLERKLKALDHAFSEHVKRDLWRNFVAVSEYDCGVPK